MGVPYTMNTDYPITELIPQRAPIIMVDRLTAVDETSGSSSFTVREDNLFLADGRLLETGMIENVAQTAAARFGCIFRSKQGSIPLGFIGAVTNLSVEFLPKAADTLVTEVRVEKEILNASLLSAKVTVDGKTAMTCEMKLFLDLR